ncbi:UPF0149 family protein [Chromatium okenii]|uniref:UPF0149 family protein n=1 Tax=Chromatium okenii TaxID=61644 RepID=UPI0026F02E7A|nr:UPF0149 family protein [Chromatium okenii]MBV5308053.1 UPF0149 family protein [Chromatium okenii]
METTTAPDHDLFHEVLALSPLDPSPSEAQGMLCGLMCGGATDPLATWLTQLLPANDAVEIPFAHYHAALHPLVQTLGAALADTELRFELGLPDDDHPLPERAVALYDWVRGFLFAIGVLGVAERDLPEQMREILHDFTELTRIDLDALDDDEDNEQALADVIEFVRVAALLIHDECALPHINSVVQP